jgi:hypothetical protein
MPNQFDGATGVAAKQVEKEEEPELKTCKWSNCEGHVNELDPLYHQGNVERQGQKLRENLFARHREPWDQGGFGESNIRRMYLDQRQESEVGEGLLAPSPNIGGPRSRVDPLSLGERACSP